MAQTFDIVHFAKLKIGESFVIEGELFKKYSDLIYTDIIGLEHYIDPLFDKKVGRMIDAISGGTPAPAAVPQVNTSATIEKADMPEAIAAPGLSDADVERIARRVKELLKES